MRGVRRLFREHGSWLAATLVVVAAVMALTGWWAIVLYSGFNAAGTILYLDGLEPRLASTSRRKRWWSALTIAHVPVGVWGVLASKSGTDPFDASLGDAGVRNQVPASGLYRRPPK